MVGSFETVKIPNVAVSDAVMLVTLEKHELENTTQCEVPYHCVDYVYLSLFG